jgi:hypothetical protein
MQSLVIIWYHLAGHSPGVVAEHRARAPWYATKTHPRYHDMITKLRRVLIAARYRADPRVEPTPNKFVPSAWPGRMPQRDCEAREFHSLIEQAFAAVARVSPAE